MDNYLRLKEKEMKNEYEMTKQVFIDTCLELSESEFNYMLGKLNALASWTDNLTDYAENVLPTINDRFVEVGL